MIIENERDISAPIRDAKSALELTVEIVVNEHIRFQQFLTCNL